MRMNDLLESRKYFQEIFKRLTEKEILSSIKVQFQVSKSNKECPVKLLKEN